MHNLVITSLYDAQAHCSCGSWRFIRTGAATRAEIEEKHSAHLINGREHPIMADETVEKLKRSLAKVNSKPDQRRRWTSQLLERMLVAERAAMVIIRGRLATDTPAEPWEIWEEAIMMAIRELRKEGKIK